jgi:hypothetical protein
MAAAPDKPLMRSLGEFFGHIVKAVRTRPERHELDRRVEEEDRGDVVLRRTTIEEIEFKKDERPE